MASNSTLARYGKQKINPALAYIPNSPTAVTTSNTRIFQIHINNTTGGAVTYVFQDGQGVTGNIFNGISIPATSAILMVWPEGLYCEDGFVWSASSASALTASIEGYYDL